MKRTTAASKLQVGDISIPINNGNGKHSCYIEILEAIHGQLSAMLSHHSRVLVIRLDLHVEKYMPDNRVLSRFIDKIKTRLAKHYKTKRLGYLWVREQERAKRQHYHLALFVDANKLQHPGRLIAWIETRWQARAHPKPHTPENCFMVVRRGDSSAYGKIMDRLSYLAKTRGKGCRADSVNDYSGSRIKPKMLASNEA